MLFVIKRYCEAGADEIKRLEQENAELHKEKRKWQRIFFGQKNKGEKK